MSDQPAQPDTDDTEDDLTPARVTATESKDWPPLGLETKGA